MPNPRASSWVDMLHGVMLESKRVVAAHSRHFLALSVLFLLPLSSLLVAAPSLPLPSPFHSQTLNPPPQSLLRIQLRRPISPPLALSLLYASAVLALSLSASSSVAHSVHHGFFGRPVKILSALRSLPSSLSRLLLTLLSAFLLLAALFTLLASLLLLSLHTLSLLHFSSHALAARIAYSIAGTVLGLGVVYLQVNWALAGVISVVESSWGFEPLRRSAHLVRGMRCAAFSLYLFFASGIGLMLWGFSLRGVGEAGNWREVVPVVARTVFGSAVTALLLLYSIVTNVVLYMYCKALHGELAREIVEEFACEYVSLPFDDQKVPHVVSVVRQ